jgi:PhzF family phenazine biosynthesis protein
MRLPIFQVDAFADRAFAGNPAAVVPLERWPDDATLQAIAAENNLAETAFFAPEGGDGDSFRLRWFTPAIEVNLCGHATLASAHVLWTKLGAAANRLRFQTRSGELVVSRDGERIALDFPAQPATRIEPPAGLGDALGVAPAEVHKSVDLLCVYARGSDVAALAPDFRALARFETRGVICTAPGEGGVDFVSRFFAPRAGIDEDPVTGSAHCALIPYWSKRLGKTRLVARQVSKRGGTLWCEDRGARVSIAGTAAPFLEGWIEL